jgi:hypothetical protein
VPVIEDAVEKHVKNLLRKLDITGTRPIIAECSRSLSSARRTPRALSA